MTFSGEILQKQLKILKTFGKSVLTNKKLMQKQLLLESEKTFTEN
jgi:hypothetical protein